MHNIYPRLLEVEEGLPVTISEVKQYLRINHQEEDDLFKRLIRVATEVAEQYLKLSIMSSTREVTVYYSKGQCVKKFFIPYGPVKAIKDIMYNDTCILDDTQYDLIADNKFIILDSSIRIYKLQLVYVAGFGKQKIPELIRQGIISHTGCLYEEGSDVLIPPSVSLSFYNPYKHFSL